MGNRDIRSVRKFRFISDVLIKAIPSMPVIFVDDLEVFELHSRLEELTTFDHMADTCHQIHEPWISRAAGRYRSSRTGRSLANR